MTLIKQFTMEQLKEMLSILDGGIWMQASVTATILEELDKTHPRIWSSPDDLIRWLYSAREAWK